jgi:hypothetical protein
LGIKDSLFQTLLERKEEEKGQRINPSWEILDDRQNPDIPAKIDQNLKICQDSFFENMDAPTGAKRILAVLTISQDLPRYPQTGFSLG